MNERQTPLKLSSVNWNLMWITLWNAIVHNLELLRKMIKKSLILHKEGNIGCPTQLEHHKIYPKRDESIASKNPLKFKAKVDIKPYDG